MFFELFDIGDSLDIVFDPDLSGDGERLGVASFLCCRGEGSRVESPSVSSICRTGGNSSSFSNDELFDIGDNFDLESLLIGKDGGLLIGLEIGLEIEINDGFEYGSYFIRGLDLLEGENEVSGEIGDNLDLDLDLEFLLSGEGERLGVESLI